MRRTTTVLVLLPALAAAAEHVRARAEAAGLADARVERLPADGQTKYAHFPSYLGWRAEEAVLEEVKPHARVVSRFPDLAVALADYSQDADVTTELVDVGDGTRAEDYAGKDVRDRIVLASGALPLVHRLACLERGARGFLSDFPNQTTAFSGDDRDLVRWEHLSPYETRNRFAFMLSKRQSEAFRARLRGGETIVVRARVKARMIPATYDVVSATLPGSDPAAGEVVLTAHLCHQSAGANDKASGSVIAEAWFDDVVAASSDYAEAGGDPRDGLVWPPGSREAFLGDVRDLEMGSDHEEFQESSFGVPMVYFHDWPDVTIHTNKDLPENLDATKLGRVAYLGAGIAWTLAALPEAEAQRLLSLVRAAGEKRAADARLQAALTDDPAADGPLFEREAADTNAARLRSLGALWPGTTAGAGAAEPPSLAYASGSPPRGGRDARVPVRSPEVRGPLGVYYYDHLEAVLGETTAPALRARRNGEVLAYECLNFVDGRRSVAEIRDVLSGRYGPVPVTEVAEYLELLARARVLSWR